MFGVKVDYEKETVELRENMEGTEEGYAFYSDRDKAEVHARNAQYVFWRQEWNHLDDYDSDRAIELEKLLWGREQDFRPGEHRARMAAKKKKEEP